MKKRMIVPVFLLLLIAGVFTIPATAMEIASGNCGAKGSNLTWTLDSEGTLHISGRGVMADYGYEPSLHAPWYSHKESVKSIIIGDYVTALGSHAFRDFTNLTSVTIPKNINKISDSLFACCYNLNSLILPYTVTSIGEYALSDCNNLTHVVLSSNLKSIGFASFWSCNALKSLIIPKSVSNIEDNAFYGCSAIEDIYYNGEQEQWDAIIIGANNHALVGAERHYLVDSGDCGAEGANLTWTLDSEGTLVINGLGAMKDYGKKDYLSGYVSQGPWFAHLDLIKTVIINNGVISIGDSAFRECTILKNVTIPDSVTSIGGGAFQGCDALTSVAIPDSFTSIGASAFSGCGGLTHMTIPNSVTSIKGYAFKGCSRLISVTIPDSVTSIEVAAFSECGSLTNVTIPDSVTTIGRRAFSECAGLTDVTIGKGVTSVGDDVFSECNNLKSVTILSPVASGVVPYNAPLTDLFIGGNVTSVDDYGFSRRNFLERVIIGNGVTSIGRCAFRYCNKLTSIIIPNSVTSIGKLAFEGCGLTGVTIPNSVISIGYGAFKSCSGLTSMTIPNGVTSIEGGVDEHTMPAGVFANCSGLKSVTIPDSVTSIGMYAFSGCSGLTSVIIPNSVTSIGYRAFESCRGLTSITIPDSCTSIYNDAFSGCWNLTDVFYTGNVEQWNHISGHGFIVAGFFPNATIHYLAESIPDSEKLNISQENAQWTLAVSGKLTFNVQMVDGSDFDVGQLVWRIESSSGQSVAEITEKGTTGENSAYAVVRGLYPGKATIVAEIPSTIGKIDITQPRASQQITVVEPKGVWFSTTASQYVVGCGQSIGIAAFIDGLTGEDTNRVTWSIADSANASVEKGLCLVTNVSAGLVKAGATVYGHVTGLTSVTVTAPDGRSATIPLLVSNAQDIQRLIITPTASGSVDADDASESQSVDWAWDKDSGSLEIRGSGAIPDYASYDETPWAKYRNEIKFVTLCDGITAVGKNAFRNCMALQEVSIPKTLASVSENAFAGDSKLKQAKWAGTPAEWDALKQNMASGNEPLKNLKRSQIEMYQDADKVPVNNAYNTTEYQNTWVDAWNTARHTLDSNIQAYMANVKSDAETEQNKLDEAEKEIEKYSEEMMIQKFSELPFTKDITFNSGIDHLFVIPSPKRVAAIKQAVYYLLYKELAKETKREFRAFTIGDINLDKGKMGKLDISEQLITVQIIRNVTEYLQENLRSEDLSSVKTTEGDTVKLCYGYHGLGLGYFIRVDGEDVDDKTVALTLDNSTIHDMTKQYMDELCAQSKKMLKEGIKSYFSYLDKIVGFTDAFKGMELESAKKFINDLLTALNLSDKWNLGVNAYKINEVYKVLKPIWNAKKMPSAEKLKEIREELQKIGALSQDDITNKSSKDIVNSINSSLDALIDGIFFEPEKTWSDTSDQVAKNFYEEWKEKVPVVADIENWFFHKEHIDCPVDFHIYDANGACVGYVENGAVWYDNALFIEVNGDCKTVYIPGDMEVRFEFIGTGDGVMTYVMEEIRSGVTVGRKNYYEIPLTKGVSYTQTFTTGSDLTSLQANPVVSADGDSIFANEYLDAKDESLEASVYVDCIVEGAGTVTGFGNFPKGNAVSLFACPEDEMEFVGWSENGVLVSADSLYQFAARENRELHALFRKPYEENDKYEISVNDEYPYSVGLAVYQDEDALAHIAITPLSSQDTTALSQVKAKRYRLDGTLYAEQTLDAAYDLKYSYWLPATDVSECAKLELFDKSEQLIAVLFSEEWDTENPATLSYRNLQRSADRVSLTAEINNPSSAEVSGQIIVAAYNSDGKMLNCSIIPDISLTTNSEAEKSAEITCQGNGNTATVKLFFLDDAWVPLASALAVT